MAEKKEKTTKEQQGQKIRIKVRAFDCKLIDQATRTIIDSAHRTGAEVRGPVPLPTDMTKYTVNRSTFVHKDSREQFEVRVHKRLIDILNPKAKTIDQLSNLNLPSGVDVEIKM
jgi:small subunit ribosomal protein S10